MPCSPGFFRLWARRDRKETTVEQLHTIHDLKARTKLSASTLRRMINSGEMLAYKVRGSIRIPESAITEYLASNRAKVR
jgi:excisionase family DNA binding protein